MSLIRLVTMHSLTNWCITCFVCITWYFCLIDDITIGNCGRCIYGSLTPWLAFPSFSSFALLAMQLQRIILIFLRF